MNKNIKTEIVNISEDFYIYKTIFADMPMLSRLIYEDDEIFFGDDITNLTFKHSYNDEFKNMSFNNVSDEDLVSQLLEDVKLLKDKYKKAIDLNNPLEFCCHLDKRDLVRQAEKMFYSEKFSRESLYDFLVEIYATIEDGHDAIFNLIEEIWLEDKEMVFKKVDKALLKNGLKEEEFIVYRGFNKHSRIDGNSFTLNKSVANFFANRWSKKGNNQNGYINKYKVKRCDILAYISYEEEIITSEATLIEKNI